ncbi:TonB-dependent receptor [Aureimonas sp. SK2]|uniref:TonB-dependent receptor n=1 Tax=Aureimonas sp. SK2 TaxID=3015992 RepID=UPI00244448FC|nr:TonB-dependent receptor [Aureimonas sp. SK2]
MLLLSGASIGAIVLGIAATHAQDASVSYDLPAQPLGRALTQAAERSGLRIIFPSDLTEGRRSPALRGSFTPVDAMNRLLAGTDLETVFAADGTVTVRREGAAAVEGGAQDAALPIGAGAPSDGVTLDTVVVTASRSPQQISETARTIYVVEGEAIQAQARAGQSLQTILGQRIPSFDAASRGARTAFGQNLRGRTALVLIDGISLNSARGLSRQFDSIDPFNIERVEVLSGATAIYGGNATGGIINIITKTAENAEAGLHGEVMGGIETGFQSGRDRDLKGGAALTWKDETWDARISLAGRDDGAYYDGSGMLLIPDITQTSYAYNSSIDLMGSLGYQIDSGRRLEVTGQFYDSRQDSPIGLYFGPNLSALRNPSLFETREGYQSDVDPRTKRSLLNASYSDEDVFGQQLLLQAFFRNEEIGFHPFPGTAGRSLYFGASQQDTDYYGFKAALVAKPLDRLSITYGVDGDVDDFSATQSIFDNRIAAQSGALRFQTLGVTGLYPDIKVSTLASFADAKFEATDGLTLSGGVRYQYVHTDVSDFVGAAQQTQILLGLGRTADAIPGGSIDYGATLFNAGATYALTDASQIYANFSQGFELPDPGKYYGIGTYALRGSRYVLLNGVDVASSALQEVKTNSFEGGYRFDDGLWNLQLAGYYSLSDKIVDINRQTLTIDVRDQDKRVYGFEAAGGVQLPYGFDTGANIHLVRTEVDRNGDWLRDTIGTSSVSKLGGHLGWANETLSVRLDGQHTFDLSDDFGGEIEGFTLFDLSGSYRFAEQDLTVDFGVLNLFDKDYTTVWGQRAANLYGALASEAIFDYRGRGRTFSVSMSKAF